MRRLRTRPRRSRAAWTGALVAVAICACSSPPGAILPAVSDAPSQDPLRASNDFWNGLTVQGLEAEHFGSLPDMTKSADLVVVGRLTDISAGREVRDLEAEAAGADRRDSSVFFGDATIVTEPAAFGPSAPSTVTLELLLPNPDLLPSLAAAVPKERAVFFLRDLHRAEPIYRLVSTQGILREIDGRVRVGVSVEYGFPRTLDGSNFENLLHEIDRLRSSATR